MNSSNSTGGKMNQQSNHSHDVSPSDLASGQSDLEQLKAEKQRLDYKAPRLNKKIRKLEAELSSLVGQGATKGGLSEKKRNKK